MCINCKNNCSNSGNVEESDEDDLNCDTEEFL